MEDSESSTPAPEVRRETWKRVADMRERLEGAEAVRRRLRGFVLANPGQAVSISIGIGFLLGFVILRRR